MFPLHICPSFILCAIVFGKDAVSNDLLLESLLDYISASDRDIIEKALSPSVALNEEEPDDFTDFLEQMSCTSIPTKENVKAVLLQIVHKEFIQKPKYALDAISNIIQVPLQQKFFSTVEDLRLLFYERKSTAKSSNALEMPVKGTSEAGCHFFSSIKEHRMQKN